jgi:hypothetical protein
MLVLVAVLVVVYIALVVCYNPTGKDELGTLGDFVGGILNPILAFASFVALLYTIKLQVDELKLTRDELSQSRKAQQDSANTLGQQRFEMTFFSLLDILVAYVKEFNSKYPIGRNTASFVDDYANRKEDAFFAIKVTYEILVMIDDYKKLNKDVNIYSGILKSCLNVSILHMILGYCYEKDTCGQAFNQISKYRDLISNYNLFEYIALDNTYGYFDDKKDTFVDNYVDEAIKTQKLK